MSRMGSHVFFNGMALGETNQINIEEGKTLVVKYLGLGDRNEDGTRTVLFELNGMRREIAVPDPQAETSAEQVRLADPQDKAQVGAPMPGMVSRVLVKEGDVVEQNQVLLIIEAMKMETSVVARMAGRVDKLHRCKGRRTAHRDQVEQRYCCHKYSKNRRMRASACFLFLCAGNVEKCGALFWSKWQKIENSIANSEGGVYNKIDILSKYIESLLLQSDGGGAIRKTLATVPRKGILQ